MTRPPTALVIFDCDGVLVDSEPIALRMLVEMLAEAGVPLDAAAVSDRFLGRSLASTRALLTEEFGLTLTDAALEDMRLKLYAAFGAELAPIPGVAETLPRLAMPFCVASSSQTERIRLSLDLTGLLPAFEAPSSPPARSPTASPRPTSSCTPPPAWASVRPPASWSRTARPGSRPAGPPACASSASSAAGTPARPPIARRLRSSRRTP